MIVPNPSWNTLESGLDESVLGYGICDFNATGIQFIDVSGLHDIEKCRKY